MFKRTIRNRADAEGLDRVEQWTRARFSLAQTDIVLVSQDDTKVPGFPPRVTTVLFWTGDRIRYRFRLFKPVAEVAESDLPVVWLRPSLLDDGDPDCC